MAQEVTLYRCPACTGPLHYNNQGDRITCEYCGSEFTVAQIEEYYREEDSSAAQAQASAEPRPAADAAAPEELPGLGQSADSNLVAYSCPACAAELICTATTSATCCPYCGNPVLVPGQLSGSFKPDFIIPFKLNKEAAVQALQRHYRKKPLLPRAFSAENHIRKLQGVYVPFWLFDEHLEGDYEFSAERVSTHREGDYRITVTRFYRIYRSGAMDFHLVPADGALKMPDEMMESVEAFDYSELRPYSPAYLPGYLADKYDVSADKMEQRVLQRCNASIDEAVRGTVGAYTSVQTVHKQLTPRRQSVGYALLPVWLLSTRWRGENYLFAMNGQTGKLVGDLPSSKGRLFAFLGAITAACGGLMALLGGGEFVAGLLGIR